MKQIQLIQITVEELETQILKGVQSQIDDLKKHFQPKEPKTYLSRRQVADLFGVDISSVSNWCKSGKLKPLGIGGRVFFIAQDVHDSLTPLNV
jgi:hypothetical protein